MSGAQPKPQTRRPRETVASLRAQLREANDTLSAIRRGEVDALVVHGREGHRVYTLETADHPYRVLVQQMHEGALILREDGVILYANPRFADLVALPADRLTANPLQAWLDPEHRDSLTPALARVIAGETTRIELRLLSASGAKIPVQISLALLPLDSTDTVCAIVIDLRERERGDRLEEAVLVTSLILDHSTAAVLITDPKGVVVYSNAAAEKLAAAPLIAQVLAETLPLEIVDATNTLDFAELIQAALGGAPTPEIHARLREASGTYVELLMTVGPFRFGDGEVSGTVVTCSDITAIRAAQQAVRESEERFRLLAESLPQIVWTANAEGRIDYYNSRAIQFYDDSLENLLVTASARVHPEDADRVHRSWTNSVASGDEFESEYRLRGKDGVYHWFLSRAVPFRDDSGKILHWLGTSTDVDSQKNTESDLRRANADLEHFAYAASHDFREPIRMVTAFTQLLSETRGADPDAGYYMQQVLDGSRRMSALLNNLLAYLEASRDHVDTTENVDCNEALSEALANLSHQAASCGAKITWDGLPKIRCARVHIVQLLQNLISNGIKYRGPEPLCIHVSAREREGEWVFSVADNGIGIAPEHRKEIFGVFKRLHGSRIPGSGMGLAICQRIVERHGGRIWVESEVGRGSKFSFTISNLDHHSAGLLQ